MLGTFGIYNVTAGHWADVTPRTWDEARRWLKQNKRWTHVCVRNNITPDVYAIRSI